MTVAPVDEHPVRPEGDARDARRPRTLSGKAVALRSRLLAHNGIEYLPLDRDEIVAAVPAGARRARSQSDYLRAAQAEPDLATVRADKAANLMEYARCLARRASWADRSTMPIRARVCAEAGFSVSTYKQCRRWWEARGYQGTVREGYTPHLRAGSLASAYDPNEAAVYVLCVPLKKRPATPRDCPSPITRPLTVNAPRTCTTREDGCSGEKPRSRALGPALARRTHLQRHADVLRNAAGQTGSERRVAWLARVVNGSGWTPADVSFAITHHPADGRYRSSANNLDNPGAWLIWRLTRWFDNPDGAWSHYRATGRLGGPCHTEQAEAENVCPADCPGSFRPGPSQSQRAAELAARDAQRRAELAADRAAAELAAVDPAAPAAAARAEMAASSPRFAAAMRRAALRRPKGTR